MNFYEIPNNFDKEIDSFENSIQQFQKGELHPTKFRAIRVPFGVYEQRTKDTFMLRIRSTAGGITPVQLKKVSELALRYCKPLVHVTTRQELQLHDAHLEDIPEIVRELYSAQLSSRGGGGNTVRNIMASSDSGINPEELFDVTPHAVALSSKLIAEGDSWNFPRKFKVSFSSTRKDNALAAFNDLGFVAATREGRRGFTVYVAGGMGCRPRLSKILHDFIDEGQVYHVCSAVKSLYLEFGNRKISNSGRLRFLWEELGEVRFREIYQRELARAEVKPVLELDQESFENCGAIRKTSGLTSRKVEGTAFLSWKKEYVSKQKQQGLYSVLIPLALGDLQARDGIILSRFLGKIGENVMRMTMTQNIKVRNIPEEYLGNLYELVSEIETLSHLPKLCGDIIGCTGANTCTTGVCLPQGLVPVVQKYLVNSDVNLSVFQDLKINISGCPNSCGQHHAADIGLYGRIVRKHGKTLPGYWVTGGASTLPEARNFTEKCGWVAARDLPGLLVDVLSRYEPHGQQGTSFEDYFKGGGKEDIADLCSQYVENIPDFASDDSYYYDWGATEEFTTAHMGHGECSAGIYDMVEVAMGAIKDNLSDKAGNEGDNEGKRAWDLVYNSAAMLLITRGVDPVSEFEVFQAFESHFLEKGLVDEKFRPLIEAAVKSDFSTLRENLELAGELGRTMIQLYHSMDNTLRFKNEREEVAVPAQASDAFLEQKELIKDLRGVVCPMNFVKTKVELAKIPVGGRLKILLDDGEPIDNVPRSVKTEGHEILQQEKSGDHWMVVIEKKV
ncbi:MAG: hypothetical protein GY702_26905 [Desulfobulbaceae bacterium]|nr:hypothetical protein [Desulfobulbaceae bacterium]